ncbi:unnamed protein product [Ascophyllum nodosum]
MRTDVATVLFGLVISGVASAAPTYSCFDPPVAEGQTSPFGASMDHLVEAGCCEALIDESDMHAERLVVWDPINCNYGSDETAITEAFLCRAHDTDGCRFCHLSCDGFEGLCITCKEIFSATASPTSVRVAGINEALSATASPTSDRVGGPTEALLDISAQFDSFPGLLTSTPTSTPTSTLPSTPAPTPPEPAPTTSAPVVATDNESDCKCLENMTVTEADVLAIRGKTMRCDRTCSNDEDLVWGVLNCNYFGLGQDCRTCADTCEEQSDGVWLDQNLAFCKPCSAIP